MLFVAISLYFTIKRISRNYYNEFYGYFWITRNSADFLRKFLWLFLMFRNVRRFCRELLQKNHGNRKILENALPLDILITV